MALLEAKGYQGRCAVVPGRGGINMVVGGEGVAGAQQASEAVEADGVEGQRVEAMRFGGLPEGQEPPGPGQHPRVGDILEPQVEGIGQPPAGALGAEHAAVERSTGSLLGQEAFGAHETIAVVGLSVAEADRHDHAVAIEGMVHRIAGDIEQPGAVAVEGAVQLDGNVTFDMLDPEAMFPGLRLVAAGPVGQQGGACLGQGHRRHAGSPFHGSGEARRGFAPPKAPHPNGRSREGPCPSLLDQAKGRYINHCT